VKTRRRPGVSSRLDSDRSINAHSHSFDIGGVRDGPADPDLDIDEVAKSTRNVAGAFTSARQGISEDVFGDSLLHRLAVETWDQSELGAVVDPAPLACGRDG